ncbi:MAG TPA: bile acid:sodium symporter family protein [Deltaproteobacteria bacterium]|nr:bile acid:sodium symporter family protein [Deltaproteobacteria bacterium]
MDIDRLQLAFDATGLLVLNGALAFIMFGVALDLSPEDFRRLARDPRAPVVGLLCQLLLLPALTFPVALAVAPTPSMALGMMLIAACPGGNVSNVLTQLAGGRVEVSVGMSAISTLAAVITTPLNLVWWGSLAPSTAALVTEVSLSPVDVAQNVAMVLLVPCTVGMLTARYAPGPAVRLRRPMKGLSIVFFGGVVASAFAANLSVFLVAIGTVALPVAVLNALALALGWSAARLAGLPEPDRRAVALEVGIQNSGLGLALIFTFFDGLGGMAAVAGWWGIWHILAGGTLAAGWAWRDSKLRT